MAIYERSGSTSPAQPSSAPPSYEPDYNSEIEMGKNQNRKGFAVKLILCVFIGFGMLGAVIYSRVELLQISNEITQTEKNYTDLQSENVRMQSEIASNTSSKNIQEYAENVLGMNPLIKVFSFTLLYRLLVAVLQPVADKRIVECMHGVAKGSMLYLKVMAATLALFLIAIAMVAASTGFV